MGSTTEERLAQRQDEMRERMTDPEYIRDLERARVQREHDEALAIYYRLQDMEEQEKILAEQVRLAREKQALKEDLVTLKADLRTMLKRFAAVEVVAERCDHRAPAHLIKSLLIQWIRDLEAHHG